MKNKCVLETFNLDHDAGHDDGDMIRSIDAMATQD